MSYKNSIKFMPIQSIDGRDLSTTYIPFANGLITYFEHEMIGIWIYNGTNRDVTLSLDGINDHFFIATLGDFTMQSDLPSSQTLDAIKIPKGSSIWAKAASAGNANDLILSGMYLDTN